MKKEWVFDRYRYGRLMAQGARVHAKTEEEALRKAQVLFGDEKDISTFKLTVPSRKRATVVRAR
jgi:hypothetical protein